MPNSLVSLVPPMAKASMLSLPTISAPASSRRSATVASTLGTKPGRSSEALVIGTPGEPDVVLETDGLASERPLRRAADPALADEHVAGVLLARGAVARIAIPVGELRFRYRQIVEAIDLLQHAVDERGEVAGLGVRKAHVRLGGQGPDLVQRRAADEAAESGAFHGLVSTLCRNRHYSPLPSVSRRRSDWPKA